MLVRKKDAAAAKSFMQLPHSVLKLIILFMKKNTSDHFTTFVYY